MFCCWRSPASHVVGIALVFTRRVVLMLGNLIATSSKALVHVANLNFFESYRDRKFGDAVQIRLPTFSVTIFASLRPNVLSEDVGKDHSWKSINKPVSSYDNTQGYFRFTANNNSKRLLQ